MKIRLADNDNNGTFLYAIDTCTNVKTDIGAVITSAEMRNYDDYRQFSIYPGRPIKMYKNIGKFYWGEGLKWLSTDNTYGTGGTLIKVRSAGYAAGNVIGYIQVTYYVAFKNFITPV